MIRKIVQNKGKDAASNRVLVVIPTLGRRLDLLEITLKSITTQEMVSADIIVVLPLKNTKACSLAKKYGALLAEDPGTLSGALNVGYKLAKPTHEFSTWMGDDDVLRPGSLTLTVAKMDARPEVVVVFGNCDYIDDKGHTIFTSRAGHLAPKLMSWGPNLVPLPGILYRHKALKKAGIFDATLKYAMDLDMLLRLKKLGKFAYINRTLGAFRWHPDSTTVANRKASLKEAALVKKRYLHPTLKPISGIWELPVSIATRMAASKVNSTALKNRAKRTVIEQP